MNHYLHPQNINLRIQYIYYESFNWNQANENFVHQINYDRLIEFLEEKTYTLKKEDILFLLKDDGAHFYEDSLRIYDSIEKNYFRVSEDWEVKMDDMYPDATLLFWVKSKTPSVKKKLDEITNDIKYLKSNFKTHIEGSSEAMRYIDTLKDEVQNLKLSNQILFYLLTKNDQKQPNQNEDIPSLSSRQASNIDPLGDSLESANPFHAFPGYPVSLQTSRSKPRGVDRTIDIALMYSDPLVKKDEYGLVSLGASVDYEEECNRLIEILRSKKKRINIYFEIATLGHLVNILSLSPTILHIICHGEFNKQRNQFYLCFEEEGRLKEIYSDELKKKLAEVDVKTKVVFVNACHSEEVAKVFTEAGVPCVIAVQSELKIEDTIAQKFSETLYWQLLEGKTIGEAFKHSKIAVSGESVYTCCCAHNHKPDCLWYDYAKKHGFEKAHHLHTPTCTNCRFENKFHHKVDCEWAMDFLLNICDNFDTQGDYLHACCCSPELIHNEALKFTLICSDKSYEQNCLFQNKETGEVEIKSNHSCVDQTFPVQKIMGRNKELYEMFSFLTDKEKKFVNLYGIEGVGKRSLAKQVANYLFERGFFRNKISIIMLEKTPSITHWRSDLFKEVDGVTDWKSFCEAIKLSKILFILEKCDELIEKNGEEFIHDLAAIVKSAIHVKFILITSKQVNLNLGEASVWMKELKKLDAAKLLCKNAYAFLNCHERNIYNLAEHPVLEMIPLTPKGIWSVAEKLRNKSLDDIAKDLQLEKGRYDEDSVEDKDELSVRTTLEEIKFLGLNTYNLVTFICHFPAGLSYEDMEELAAQGRIPTNWKGILISFLKSRKPSDSSQDEMADENGVPDKVYDRSDFKLDNYIWINISKDPLINEIYFIPTQFVFRYIENNLNEDSVVQGIKKLEYMTILALAMIEKAKANFDYNEKLVEFSLISNYGIWKAPNNNSTFNIYDPNNKVSYLNSADLNLSNLKMCFAYHEANFLSCLDLNLIKSTLTIDSSKRDHLIEIIEILCLAIPTLWKVVYPGESPTGELARKAGKILECMPDEPRLYVVKTKLYLFLTAMYLSTKTDYSKNFSLARIQLDLASEIAGRINDLDVRQAVLAEIAFTNAFYYYRGYKKNCLRSEEASSKQFVYKEINDKLKNAESFLSTLPEQQLYKVFKAKITLLASKTKEKFNKLEFEAKFFEDMKEAQSVLKVYNSQRLLMKIHYIYACLKLKLERKRIGNKFNTTAIENTRIVTQELVKTKNNHLIKIALEIARSVLKDKLYESKIKRKIDEINVEIRHGYFNVIILMRANPIVDVKTLSNSIDSTDRRSETELIPTSFPTRIASTWKSDLLHTLGMKNKVLYTKFEILTLEKLKDCVQNGCRVLQINCHCIEPNYLCVEGEYGKLERISYEKIREIFDPKPAYIGSTGSTTQNDGKLDVLILGVKNDLNLAQFFVDLKIPHIITFEFTSNEFDFRHKMLEDECINKFTICFYEQLVSQTSVIEAFECAYEKTFEYLSETYFDGKMSGYAKKIIGQGPILFPKDGDHSEVLFTDFPLAKGKIEDISSQKCPTNIEKFKAPYTGRNKEIYGLTKKICDRKGFIKVTGPSGSGKTAFVLQVAKNILTRNIFPDGIFYIPSKKLKHKPHSTYDLKELIKETLGLNVQSGVKNFFKGKNMLLIFDDFDYFYNKDVESPQLIFPIKDCSGVACLLITTSKPKVASNTKVKHRKIKNQKKTEIEGELLDKKAKWKLKPLSDDDLSYMLLSLIKIDKKNANTIHIQNIKESIWIKNAQGSPKILIEDLLEKRIEIQKKVLEINPDYEKNISFEQKYLAANKKNPSMILSHSSSFISSLPGLQKQGSSTHSDLSKLSRMHTINSEPKLPFNSPIQGLRKESKVNSLPPDAPKSKDWNNKSQEAEKQKNQNQGKGLKTVKKSSIGEVEESFLPSKSDFEMNADAIKKGASSQLKPGDNCEEEKKLHETTFEDDYELRQSKEGESLFTYNPDQPEFMSDSEDINSELIKRLNITEIEETSADIITESNVKTSPDLSLAESEIVPKSQRKTITKDDSQKAPPQGGSKSKTGRSGRHINKYQKKKKSNYYQFKEKTRENRKKNSSDSED